MNYKEELLTGASGAHDADSKEAERHAALYYESIRNRASDSDVTSIAKNINFPEKVVKAIKQHIFLDVHDLGGGLIGRFAPSYEIPRAWDRLIQGNHIDIDIMLMKHELVELTQMKRHGYDYVTAHTIAEQYHNWAQEINKLKGG